MYQARGCQPQDPQPAAPAAALLTHHLIELIRLEALHARGVSRQRELLLFTDLIQRLPDQCNLFVLGGGAVD
jgi:hypothetical protein